MKTLKNAITGLALFTMLLIVGCKKDKINADGQEPGKTNAISVEELENYYIVSELKTGGIKMALIYFTKEGGTVKANLHFRGVLRSAEAKITDGKFNFDYNNDGQGVFTYELEKTSNGLISLKSYQYINKTNATQGLNYSLLATKETSSAFSNSSYKIGNLLFNVTNKNIIEWNIALRETVQVINGVPFPIFNTAPEFTKPIYNLANIGFKSNDDDIFAVAVPKWKETNTPLLLVEKNGTAIMPAVKQ